MESAKTGDCSPVRASGTGERGVRKRTRLVRRGAHGKGQQWTSPGAYPTLCATRLMRGMVREHLLLVVEQ